MSDINFCSHPAWVRVIPPDSEKKVTTIWVFNQWIDEHVLAEETFILPMGRTSWCHVSSMHCKIEHVLLSLLSLLSLHHHHHYLSYQTYNPWYHSRLSYHICFARLAQHFKTLVRQRKFRSWPRLRELRLTIRTKLWQSYYWTVLPEYGLLNQCSSDTAVPNTRQKLCPKLY